MKKGFTLLEMLISIGIISLVFLAASGISSYTVSLQRKAGNLANLQREANSILSLMAKDIRQNRVDYSYYNSGTIPPSTEILALLDYALIDDESRSIVYRHIFSDKIIQREIGEESRQINSIDVEVTTLEFRISPNRNPFGSEATFRQSPRVTIILGLKSKENTFLAQQTVIQRYSERK